MACQCAQLFFFLLSFSIDSMMLGAVHTKKNAWDSMRWVRCSGALSALLLYKHSERSLKIVFPFFAPRASQCDAFVNNIILFEHVDDMIITLWYVVYCAYFIPSSSSLFLYGIWQAVAVTNAMNHHQLNQPSKPFIIPLKPNVMHYII